MTEVKIAHYPVIDDLKEVQSTAKNITDTIEEEIIPAIDRQSEDIYDLTIGLIQLDGRIDDEVEVINNEQIHNYNRQKKFLIAAIIYALLSTSAIVYLLIK